MLGIRGRTAFGSAAPVPAMLVGVTWKTHFRFMSWALCADVLAIGERVASSRPHDTKSVARECEPRFGLCVGCTFAVPSRRWPAP